MSDLIALINEAVKEVLPGLNKNIQASIRQDGLDPMTKVISGHENAGSINLGICTAHAGVSYSLRQLTGLSSLTIESVTVCGISGDINSFSSSISINLKLSKDLDCNVAGKVSAGCGFIHKSAGLSGKLDASGITLSATGVLKGGASLQEQKVTIQSINVSSLNLEYKDVSVKIDGLGIFNSLLEIISSSISGIFKQYITSSLSQIITGIINEEMRSVFPITVKIPIPAELN